MLFWYRTGGPKRPRDVFQGTPRLRSKRPGGLLFDSVQNHNARGGVCWHRCGNFAVAGTTLIGFKFGTLGPTPLIGFTRFPLLDMSRYYQVLGTRPDILDGTLFPLPDTSPA